LYQKVQEHPQAAAELNALRLRLTDATIVSLSSKLLHFGLTMRHRPSAQDNAPYRQLKAIFDLSEEGLPSLLHLCRQQSENSDAVALGQTMLAHNEAGDLWIFDKGCHDRAVMLALHRAGAFFITPHSTQKLHSLRTLLERQPPPETSETGADALPQETPPFHLLRVEEAYFENSLKRRCWQEMPLLVLSGIRYDRRRHCWQPLVLLSNLPLDTLSALDTAVLKAGPYDVDEVAQLYRRRWEIETFFKFLKGHLSYTHLVNRSPNGVEVVILTQLIASLLLIQYRREHPNLTSWRSAKFWFREEVAHWTRTLLEEALIKPAGPTGQVKPGDPHIADVFMTDT